MERSCKRAEATGEGTGRGSPLLWLFVVIAMAMFGGVACGEVTESGPDGSTPSSADAGPNSPDGMTNTPDAMTNTPDADPTCMQGVFGTSTFGGACFGD